MIALMAFAEVASAPVSQASSKQWYSVNHDFGCALRTERGEVIHIEGDAKLAAVDRDGKTVLTRGTFQVRSKDRKWSFINESAGTQGNVVQLAHNVHFDVSDGADVATAKTYDLDMTFSSRIDGMRGPYGYAVLRDGNDGTPFVLEGRANPIMAIGVCEMTPKEGAAR